MTTKIITATPLQSKDQAANKKFYINRTYGKPTKPRYQEPSMYEILSWKSDRAQQQGFKAYDAAQSNEADYFQPVSIKRLMPCKSLPADQFVRSKHTNNLTFDPNTQDYDSSANIQKVRTKNISNHSEYSLNPNNKTQSLKRITNSIKNIESSKMINIGYIQNQPNNTGHLKKFSQVNNQKNTKKLQKKVIPAYTNSQSKPRYMQQKKSAVQKLIDSPSFDKQKFQKMKYEQIKRFKQTTRDLSNTAFLTYFNKPPFENYGRENKHSSGVLYGDYMYSHNVYPHTGDNHPEKQQTYVTALSRAKSAGNIRPHPPLTRHLEEKLISGYLTLSQIYPKNTSSQSIPIKNQTVLQNLPMFNYVKSDDENYKKYSPYLNAHDNQELFHVQNQYLKRQQIPKYFSNKDQIEEKQNLVEIQDEHQTYFQLISK